jgi:hypothetical protein
MLSKEVLSTYLKIHLPACSEYMLHPSVVDFPEQYFTVNIFNVIKVYV